MKLKPYLLGAACLLRALFLVQRGCSAAPVASAIRLSQVVQCETLRHHGDPGHAAPATRGSSHSADPGDRGRGLVGIAATYDAANEPFRAAVKARPKDAESRSRPLGPHVPGALAARRRRGLFQEALKIDENNAQALSRHGASWRPSTSRAKAIELAEKALKADPKLYEAREAAGAHRARRQRSEEGRRRSRARPSTSRPKRWTRWRFWPPSTWLNDKTDTPWIDRILKINPIYGEAYSIAGHFFVINRRYDEGIAHLPQGAGAQSRTYGPARAELGVNLMRSRRRTTKPAAIWSSATTPTTPSREASTRCGCWTATRTTKPSRRPPPSCGCTRKKPTLLRPYFQAEFDRAIATYEKKYKYKLNGPVQVEVYPDHEDFAVRTMGMPGLGALGVTFGNVVAMDSPSGRPPGQFPLGQHHVARAEPRLCALE